MRINSDLKADRQRGVVMGEDIQIIAYSAVYELDELLLGHITAGIEGVVDASAFYVFLVKQVFADELVDERLVPKDLGGWPLDLDVLGPHCILEVFVRLCKVDGVALVINVGHF